MSWRLYLKTVIEAIQDLASGWNSRAQLDINRTELAKILLLRRHKRSCLENIQSLYALFLVESLAFFSQMAQGEIGAQSLSVTELFCLVGFGIFASAMMRPCSRAGMWNELGVEQARHALETGSLTDPIELGWAGQKTAKTQGAAFYGLLSKLRPIWQAYIDLIRPVVFARKPELFSKCTFFPSNTKQCLKTFLEGHVQDADTTLAQIRVFVSRDVAELSMINSGEYKAATLSILQKCCGHDDKKKLSVVDRHYAMGRKPLAEGLIRDFVERRYIVPVESQLRNALGLSASPTAMQPPFHMPYSSPVVTKKRKRNVIGQSMKKKRKVQLSRGLNTQPIERVCRNRQRGRRCISGNVAPTFSSLKSPNCERCVEVFAGSVGNHNMRRWKQFRDAQDLLEAKAADL